MITSSLQECIYLRQRYHYKGGNIAIFECQQSAIRYNCQRHRGSTFNVHFAFLHLRTKHPKIRPLVDLRCMYTGVCSLLQLYSTPPRQRAFDPSVKGASHVWHGSPGHPKTCPAFQIQVVFDLFDPLNIHSTPTPFNIVTYACSPLFISSSLP
ncbi:hypothetical protein BC629DRAFT_433228 [Irpex lacteus]|nr:hypothetical protein BC629DRAFT_433228 [Irpex lacteus]